MAMTPMTLLELTNKILNKISGSPVDSIFDTEESELIANEVLDVFKSIHSRSNDKFTKGQFQLEDLAVPEKFKLYIPDNVQYVDDLRYKGKRLTYLDEKSFEDLLATRTDTSKYDTNGYGITEDPKYFTSYDDKNVIFDSIIDTGSSLISGADTSCSGKVIPVVELLDTYIPTPLPPSYESALLAEATGICLNRYREVSASYDFGTSQETFTRMNSRNNQFKNQNYLDDFDGWGYK